MRIILDTNVLVSGIFFHGPPHQILKAWRVGKLELAVSPKILEEYYRVSEALVEQYATIDLRAILELVTIKAEMFTAESLPRPVCVDPDDDKFLACALASGSKLIISGDRHLLQVSGFQGILVLKPRQFVGEYLAEFGKR
ncbi:MAG TPA: putative toxin-antitoxin system toxin component, PIN family [Desulfomonilaceae bacterium]|nr:putative toxin-antitoxin system toxin component, PIN family [Desulfomonilaceae bacterium]